MRRASSPTVTRSSIWNGSGAEALSTSISLAMTSISPVGRSGLALPSGRALTSPVDPHAVLVAQVVGATLLEHLVADDHLGDAAGVAQIQERHSTVIAPTGDPAGERDGLAGVVGAQGAGLMGAKHERSFDSGGGEPGHPTDRATRHTNRFRAQPRRPRWSITSPST